MSFKFDLQNFAIIENNRKNKFYDNNSRIVYAYTDERDKSVSYMAWLVNNIDDIGDINSMAESTSPKKDYWNQDRVVEEMNAVFSLNSYITDIVKPKKLKKLSNEWRDKEFMDIEYFNNAMDAEVYQAIELARKVDKTLTNPQAPIAEVLQVMNEVFQANYKVNLYYLLPKVAETDEEDQTDYFLGLQPERIYRLQLTPAQLATQWERLVAHYSEKKPLNQSYYSLLARNFGAVSLSHKIFNTPNPLTLTDYKAICYLVENYSAVKDEKIDVYTTSLYRTIKELATNKVVPFKELQHTLLEAEKQQLLSLNNLVDFYEKYTPNELTSFFVTYFNALKAEGGGSVLAALDKRFEQQKENSDWKRYKYQFALVANNIAWKVFEEENTDVSKVTQAVEWAKIAADLVPENPFMLDTLACLLYTQGDKATASSIQQKAVKLMKVLVETEEESVSDLKEMEKHLSIFNAK